MSWFYDHKPTSKEIQQKKQFEEDAVFVSVICPSTPKGNRIELFASQHNKPAKWTNRDEEDRDVDAAIDQFLDGLF